MALVKCSECGREISDKAPACLGCGAPMPGHAPAQFGNAPIVMVAKSRGIYIVLGLLFGAVGFHNFYAGDYLKGACKFVVLMVALVLDVATNFYTAWFLVAAGLFTVWALLEILLTNTDSNGNRMT
ncbi:TM2 domain-containing protein [Xanthomonas translucens pv. translucens]|uniref:NINE protein n=1 Tax=Xanthomonas campestris pv. translucens TaxID=343 RepID=UPI003F72C5D3